MDLTLVSACRNIFRALPIVYAYELIVTSHLHHIF